MGYFFKKNHNEIFHLDKFKLYRDKLMGLA
jgi:hypothetical protein